MSQRKKADVNLNLISDPRVVGEACLPILRSILNQPQLGFHANGRASNITHLALTGANQRLGVARDTYPVHPLLGTQELFWVGVTLDFRYISPAFRLTSVGVIIFKGLASGDERVPFLRAEWHCSEDDLAASHAQPHWHVYPTPERTTDRFGEEDSEVYEFGETDSGPQETAPALPFHFAMCATWQLGNKGFHKGAIQKTSELADWLGGCIGYIASELS
jgi:hypothetical protein